MKRVRRSSRASELSVAELDEETHRLQEFLEGPLVPDGEGKACELHTYHVRYDSRGGQVCLQVGSKTELVWDKDQSHEAALVVKRWYNSSKELRSTQLAIQSPYIKTALREVVGKYPGIDLESSGPIYMFEAPRFLFHYREELRLYAAAAKDETVERHVNLALKYMNQALRQEISTYSSMMENDAVAPGLEYSHLWMAFKPGSLLYHELMGNEEISRLIDMVLIKEEDHPDRWNILREEVGCAQATIGHCSLASSISRYDGYRPLSELECFPLQYHITCEQVKERVLSRGRKYVALCGVHYKLYEGPLVFNNFSNVLSSMVCLKSNLEQDTH